MRTLKGLNKPHKPATILFILYPIVTAYLVKLKLYHSNKFSLILYKKLTITEVVLEIVLYFFDYLNLTEVFSHFNVILLGLTGKVYSYNFQGGVHLANQVKLTKYKNSKISFRSPFSLNSNLFPMLCH